MFGGAETIADMVYNGPSSLHLWQVDTDYITNETWSISQWKTALHSCSSQVRDRIKKNQNVGRHGNILS